MPSIELLCQDGLYPLPGFVSTPEQHAIIKLAEDLPDLLVQNNSRLSIPIDMPAHCFLVDIRQQYPLKSQHVELWLVIVLPEEPYAPEQKTARNILDRLIAGWWQSQQGVRIPHWGLEVMFTPLRGAVHWRLAPSDMW